ncbi:MAG: alkane 1-monooxygenase [Flavisolibacter sp.]
MRTRVFKYLSPFLLYFGAIVSFLDSGFVVWLPLVYSWIIIPLAELFTKPDDTNLSLAEEELARKNKAYDLLLYLVVPCQYFALGLYLYTISKGHQSTVDTVGKTMVMGLLCGVMGINVGHELGHRIKKFEQVLAKLLLMSSLYMHFFIEHNKGHHKRVGTPADPASARLGEPLYLFYYRAIVFGYRGAWKIANRDARKRGDNAFSIHNEMLQFHFIQAALVVVILYLFGWQTTLLFLAAALQGILLLETVNYIEHYGLQRKQIAEGKYQRAMPEHSWNSNHIIGRVMLFELSRHSDHHYLASRKYQVLRHHDNSPQMPTGYPGMMLLATIPPLWFRVMNKRVQSLEDISESKAKI